MWALNVIDLVLMTLRSYIGDRSSAHGQGKIDAPWNRCPTKSGSAWPSGPTVKADPLSGINPSAHQWIQGSKIHDQIIFSFILLFSCKRTMKRKKMIVIFPWIRFLERSCAGSWLTELLSANWLPARSHSRKPYFLLLKREKEKTTNAWKIFQKIAFVSLFLF